MAALPSREFHVKLRGLSSDSRFLSWLKDRPREVTSDDEAQAVIDRM